MIDASPAIKEKLKNKHGVEWNEVIEAFGNRNKSAGYLEELRPIHQSNPRSLWFIAETDRGRCLKIVFIDFGNDQIIRTAFEATGHQIIQYLDGTNLKSIYDLNK